MPGESASPTSGDGDAVDLGEDGLLPFSGRDGRDDGVRCDVDDVGDLVEHHQRLPATAGGEAVDGPAQPVERRPGGRSGAARGDGARGPTGSPDSPGRPLRARWRRCRASREPPGTGDERVAGSGDIAGGPGGQTAGPAMRSIVAITSWCWSGRLRAGGGRGRRALVHRVMRRRRVVVRGDVRARQPSRHGGRRSSWRERRWCWWPCPGPAPGPRPGSTTRRQRSGPPRCWGCTGSVRRSAPRRAPALPRGPSSTRDRRAGRCSRPSVALGSDLQEVGAPGPWRGPPA